VGTLAAAKKRAGIKPAPYEGLWTEYPVEKNKNSAHF